MKNLVGLTIIFLSMNAWASNCQIRIIGFEQYDHFAKAKELLLQKGYTSSPYYAKFADFKYCENCGYYGEGSVLELQLGTNEHYQIENYSFWDMEEMIHRLVSKVKYCSN